ncbi:MAG: DUF1707 domain-containing protein [Solirubrobacteraceae bacterium]
MSGEQSLPKGPADGVRASDEDRERLISELNEHAVAGRLSTDELEDRLEAAYGARTTAELDALRRDLPTTAAQTALAARTRRSHLIRRMIQETGGSAGLFVVCTLIWLASGASGSFWPVWVLIVVVLSLVRDGWALFGPAPDLDAVEANLEARRARRTSERQRRAERRGRRRG